MAPAAYWPFWLSGALLGSIAVGFWIVLRYPLGVSGMLARFTNLRAELAAERAVPLGALSEEELERAMMEATLAAFGDVALPEEPAGAEPVVTEPANPAPAPHRTMEPAPSLAATAGFFVALAAGGAVAALLRHGWHLRAGLGPAFAGIFGSGLPAAATLLAGGFLVGAGTSLCGGCSSGHGLTGCSRLQPGSLLAVMTFMASAIATSLLLAWRATS